MAVLTGEEIIKRVELGDIEIDGFDHKMVNPNSYNLTLGDELLEFGDIRNCPTSWPTPWESGRDVDPEMKVAYAFGSDPALYGGGGADRAENSNFVQFAPIGAGNGLVFKQIVFPYVKPYMVPTHKRKIGMFDPVTRKQEATLTGWFLTPQTLYLGCNKERIHSKKFIPIIDGRSGTGRLGIFVHATAGFGDLGFNGTFTLEIVTTNPTLLCPGMPICQVYFHTPEGSTGIQYEGRYQGQTGPRPSTLWKSFDAAGAK